MAKTNPLFVDSTVLHGDRIGTQVELSKVVAYEGENIVVVITNHLGEANRVNMKLSEGGHNYQARVWLGHQKSLTYRFVIEREGREFLQSPTRQARAQYAIVDEWEPVLVETGARAIPVQESTASDLPPAPFPGDYASTVASLIEKWGL